MHYNPVIARLKRLVSSGEIGKIRSFNATNITLSPVWAFPWQGVPEKSYGKRVPLKQGDSRFRGGALCDHPHIFDMVRHITGSDFDMVYAEAAPNIRPDIEEEDMLSVIGKMKDGTVFSLDPSWSKMEERLKIPGPGWEVFPKRMEVNITLNGEKGTIMADCFGPNVYHTETVRTTVNSGKAIENEILRGSVLGKKTDEDGFNICGALFGLFRADETEFTEETALLTCESNEIGVFLFENVPYGKWIVREIKPAPAFVLNGSNYGVIIDKDGETVQIEVENRFSGLPKNRYTVQYTYFDEWIGMIDEFVDNIRNNKTPLINLRWHRRTIEAMNAVYESISTGKSIKF